MTADQDWLIAEVLSGLLGESNSALSPHDIGVDSMMSSADADADDSGSRERQGEPQDAGGEVSPLTLRHDDGMDFDGEATGRETQQNGLVVHNPSQEIDGEEADAAESEVSDHDMDITPEKPPVKKPGAKNVPSQQSSINRPRKRRRILKNDNDEGDAMSDLESSSGTRANPIDVDLYISMWEPTTVKEFVSIFHWSFSKGSHQGSFWQVEVQEPNFVNSKTLRRFKCDTEIRAFDANGGEHRFTPECHVSCSVSWKSSPITTSFSLTVALLKSNSSSITLTQVILKGNHFISQIPKRLVSTLFPLWIFKACQHDKFKIDFAANILSLPA